MSERTSSGVRRKVKIIGLVIGLGLVITLVGICVLAALFVFRMRMGLNRSEEYLKQRAVYEPVGRTLALYCQSDPTLFPHELSPAWLPKVVSSGPLGRSEISSNAAWMICGGGFGHWGYVLNLDRERSANGTNAWQMYFRREESPDEFLATFDIPATNSISASDLSSNVVANYDSRLAANPRDLPAHQAKIQCLLHFGKIPEARQACRDVLKSMPEDSWGNLVNALILAQTKNPDAGEKLITQWADRNPNFFSYLDLAYYYQLQKESQKAAAAMVKATGFDANTDWGDGGNSEFRGYHAAFYAYQAGQYQATVKLCDKLLPVTVNGDYAKNQLRELRNAAILGSEGKPTQISLSPNMLVFDPFELVDLDKLLQTNIDRPHEPNRWNQ